MSDDTITTSPQRMLPAAESPKPKPALIAGNRPTAIVPVDIDQVWRLATIIAQSGMAPKDFKTQNNIAIAIMHGLEVGLPPMQALQRIAVINGRPALWGDAMIGLVRASRLPEYIDETFTGQGDDLVAVCKTKRRGDAREVVRTFSVVDAKKARLWDTRERVKRQRNSEWVELPNDAPWFRFPKRMLQMRARALTLRDTYADVLGGLYMAEELIGEMGDDAIDVTPAEQQPVRKAPPPPPGVAGAVEAKVEPPKPNGAAPAGDGLDIPAALRRTPGPLESAVAALAPPPKDAVLDEDEWLNSLSNAYSGCEDLHELNEQMLRLAEPQMEVASNEAWDRAKDIYEEHSQRIRETA